MLEFEAYDKESFANSNSDMDSLKSGGLGALDFVQEGILGATELSTYMYQGKVQK